MTEQAASSLGLEANSITDSLTVTERARSLAIVDGYIPGIDYRNKRAVRHGLILRKAIVFDTLSYSDHDVYFDAQLFLEITRALIAALPHDELEIKSATKEIFSSFDGYCAQVFAVSDPTEREPYRYLNLRKDGKPICMAKTEYYVGLPGPKPYEDSYTLSIYVGDTDTLGAVEKALHEACLQFGVTINHQVRGDQTPQGYRFKRVFNWLFG